MDLCSQLQVQLCVQNICQVRPITEVYPLSTDIIPSAFFLGHLVALDNPVEPLGAGYWRAEPYLLVRGLLVEDVGADPRNDDVENSGLCQTCVSKERLNSSFRTNELHIHCTRLPPLILALPGSFLSLPSGH